MMMSLTEEERELITWMREDADKWLDACWDADTERPRKVLTLCNLIDRLVAENEELKLESIPRTTSEIEEMLRVDKVILQTLLSLSTEREERYRKALEEIGKLEPRFNRIKDPNDEAIAFGNCLSICKSIASNALSSKFKIERKP